jgi:hypothetical protein
VWLGDDVPIVVHSLKETCSFCLLAALYGVFQKLPLARFGMPGSKGFPFISNYRANSRFLYDQMWQTLANSLSTNL